MNFEIIEWLHIVNSTILFGTGIGSAFLMFVANRTGNIQNIYFSTRYVIIADFIFTAPAIIIQLTTGLFLMNIAGYQFDDLWLLWGFALFILIVICWIPVVLMKIKMRDLAKECLDQNTKLPKSYWKIDKWLVILGSLAFPAMLIIFYLMIIKPF
ncbi:MAG: putative membrane protein [Rickettsiales bacterium]|jgi:uncharacterized membrane protein